jgi:hypothetical protein
MSSSSSSSFKKEFEWLVKKGDFVHWGNKISEKAETCPQPEMPDCCDPANKSSSSSNIVDPSFLQRLRMNPSLVKANSGLSANKDKDKDTDDKTHPGSDIESPEDEELTKNRSFSSFFMLHSLNNNKDNKDDATHPGSDVDVEKTEEQKKEEEEKKRRRAFFLWGVVLAILLAILAAALGVLIYFGMRTGPTVTSLSNCTDVMNMNSTDVNSTIGCNSNSTLNGTVFEDNLFLQANSTSAPTADSGNETTAENVTTLAYDYFANTNFTVGTYYYPWYGEDFHNNEGYLRRDLQPPQQPELGEYNSSETEVIGQHMKWFRQSNINLLVTSWWGPNRMEDNTTRYSIMEHEDVGNLQIALHYETKGRLKDQFDDMTNPRTDIQYMCENYFDHPNYYKIDGRPVLVVYVTRSLQTDGVLEEALLTMRSEANKCGHNLYLIGDHVYQSAPDPEEVFMPFWYFDAVTTYDVYGSNGMPYGYAGQDLVDGFYSEQERWKNMALLENCQYIPPVSPGYNDRSVRLYKDHPPLSRRLTPFSEEGSLFWYQLKKALPLASPDINNMILVNSFNEWHEDTQIEPVMGAGPAGAATTRPPLLTGGMDYAAYGELYLDLLGAATSKNAQETELFDGLYGIGI